MIMRILHTLLLAVIVLSLSSARLRSEDTPKSDPPKGKGKGKAAEKGNKDGIEFILAHEKELNLAPAQKKELSDLSVKVEQLREKYKEDPEIKDLYRELYEARQSGDEEAIRPVRKRLREAMEKKGGVTFESMLAEVGKILNPEQLRKLAELRKEHGMDPNPGQTMKGEKKQEAADATPHNKPDATKGTPKIYDDEK